MPPFRLVPLLMTAAASFTLAGCVGTTALSELEQARPIGGPFSQALFKNYAALAHSFGTVGTPTSGTPFDADQSFEMGSMSSDVADIANTYAQKAIATAQGDEILPEGPDVAAPDSEAMHLHLLAALDQGRDKVPDQAARAQADYDCWVINARSDELRRASQQCRRSLSVTLARLENDLAASAPPPTTATPQAAPTTPVDTSSAPSGSELPSTSSTTPDVPHTAPSESAPPPPH
ncbi:MAG: hypothetical protein ACJ8EL_12895 [Rhizomicrobium sp.]